MECCARRTSRRSSWKRAFISNNGEERLLGSDDYQEQIAEAIYNGLRNYFMQHPLQSAPRGEAAQTASAAAPGGMLIN